MEGMDPDGHIAESNGIKALTPDIFNRLLSALCAKKHK